jgi:hypothetical protein
MEPARKKQKVLEGCLLEILNKDVCGEIFKHVLKNEKKIEKQNLKYRDTYDKCMRKLLKYTERIREYEKWNVRPCPKNDNGDGQWEGSYIVWEDEWERVACHIKSQEDLRSLHRCISCNVKEPHFKSECRRVEWEIWPWDN